MSSILLNDVEREKQFGIAANHMITVKGLLLTSDQRLQLYSLFKQATEGDCNHGKPSLIDLVGRAKWKAWTEHKGMKSLEAMAAYVAIVTELCPNWRQDADLNAAGAEHKMKQPDLMEDQRNAEDWGPGQQVFDAVVRGDLARLEDLTSRGEPISVQYKGQTPLHFAADRGHPAIISRLLELGAAVDAPDSSGMTPLSYAVACENEEEIKLLVKAGADVNYLDKDGRSPLSSAKESLRHLLLPTVTSESDAGS